MVTASISISFCFLHTDNEVVQGISEERIKLISYFHSGNKYTIMWMWVTMGGLETTFKKLL